MADINAQSSYHGHPPKKRARIDSYLEESLSSEGSKSGNTQEEEEEEDGGEEEEEEEEDGYYDDEVEEEEEEEVEEDEEEDASPSLSSSTHQGSLSTSQDHYRHLLATTGGPNGKPMISVCDRNAILAVAAAREPSTIGKLLQQKYDVAWARLQRNSRIINFDDDYQRVGGLLSSLPQDLDPFESGTQMRQACTTIDQIFDSILRQVDDESQLETKMSAARTMQRILRRLLIYSIESGNMIPDEFSWDGQDRLGLDGKMFMLINDKFDHRRHDIKMMMVSEDVFGESDWVERVKELVRLSSRGGKVFKKLTLVLEMVKNDAYDPSADYDSCGMPTF